ncbi:hypothetical protein ALC57_05917 [Trachymyrmex cornetzi]|uniref:Uncharacterized protein n=1 Tax=Trachymyrmex cornetzi TaxID=471704 RepID=A0A151J9G9_9HYME|nr:hypothetical protein ALC57_05917 [Trachymyrmex cornetzi]
MDSDTVVRDASRRASSDSVYYARQTRTG